MAEGLLISARSNWVSSTKFLKWKIVSGNISVSSASSDGKYLRPDVKQNRAQNN